MQYIKKGIALFLAIVMVITLLPANALAAEVVPIEEQESEMPEAEEVTDETVPEEVTVEASEYAVAAASESDGYTYYEDDGWTIRNDGIITKVKYNHYLDIPSMIAGFTVKGVADGILGAFVQLQRVTFPESVEYIGNGAFTNCYTLKEVNFPSSLTYIGERAFEGTAISGTVVLPKGITEISAKAFMNTNINEVVIQGEVTKIGDNAFSGCDELVTMELPDSVTSIGSRAFDQCISYKAAMPPNVTSLGEYAFCGTLIEEATLSDTFEKIPVGLFKGCKELVSVEMSPKVINNNAFNGCEKLKTVNWGDNLTDINEYAFYGCSSLENITIPDGVTDIMGHAFDGTSLKTVHIPKKLTWLQGNLAFRGCETLESYTVDEGNSTFFARDGVLYENGYGTLMLLHYPMGKKESASYSLPNDIVTMGGQAFHGNEAIKQVIVQDNPNFYFGRTAFEGLNSLMELKVDSSVSFYNKDSSGKAEGTLISDFENTHKFTIYGEKGSQAQEFAEKYGYPFRSNDQFQLFANNVPDDRMQITILDEEGYPLKGASVKVDDGDTVITDEKGIVEFADEDYKEIKLRKIEIVLEGYNTKIIYREIGFGIGVNISLKKSDGKPYIISAVLDKEQDLLSQKVVMEKTGNDADKNELIVTADFGDGEEWVYEILQGGSVKASSTEGVFSADLSYMLDENEPLYLRVQNTNGVYSDLTLLSLTIVPEGTFTKLPEKGFLELIEEWTEELPGDLPAAVKAVLGNAEVKHSSTGKFPVTITSEEDGKVKIAINMDESKFASVDEFKDFYQSFRKENGKLSLSKLLQEYDGKTLNQLSVKGKVIGYGEGYIDRTVDGEIIIHFTAGAIGEVTGKGIRSYSFFMGETPAYVKGNYEVKGSTEFSNIQGRISTDETEPLLDVSYYGDTISELKIKGEVGGGVGLYRLLSAGLTGGFTFKNVYRWQAKSSTGTITPNIGYEAYVAGFTISEDYLGEKDVTYTLWPKEESASVEAEESGTYAMQRMSRAYLANYSEETTDEGTTITGIYPNAQPKQVTCGDTTYLFWLEDDQDRTDINRSCLVYAVVNADGTLGEKKAVENDGTADFDFQVAADDSGIYVVWQDAKDVLGEDTTMIQQLNNLELTVGAFDVKSGEWNLKNITGSTTCLNMNPMLSLSSDKICVSWDTLDGEDYFSADAVAESRYVELDKSLATSVSKNYTADGMVLYTAMGSVAGKNTYAYIVDTDRDFNTYEDRKVQIIDLADPDNIWKTLNVSASTLQFAKLNGTDALFLGCDEALCYTEDLKNVVAVENANLSGADFKVTEDVSGNTCVYYQISKADEDKTRYYIYMNVLENGTWSDAQVVYASENPMKNLCINQDSDGNILIMFMETVDGIATLRTMNVNNVQVFEITDALCEVNAAAYGQPVNLHINVNNPGKGAAEITKLEVLRGEEVIYTKSYENYKVAAGSDEQITIDDFKVPEDLTGPEEFTIKVYGSERAEKYVMTLGYTDLTVATENYLDNGVDMLSVNVSNFSQMATDAKVSVYRVEDMETPVYEEEVMTLTTGQTQNLTFNVDQLKDSYDVTSLYVEVAAEKEEEFKEDNATYAVISIFGQGETEPKKLSLDKDSLVAYVGEEDIRLTPTLTPVSVENPEYTWKSTNEAVLTVNADGTLKLKKPGIASVVCSYGNLKDSCTVKVRWDSEYEIIKEVTDWKELESDHNYTHNLNKTWVYTDETRQSLAIKFDAYSYVDYGDKLYIFDENDNQIECLEGYINNKVVSVDGSTVKLKLVTNNSYGAYGFKVSQIADYVEDGSMVNRVTENFESDHSYAIPYDTSWIYESKGAQALKIKFSEDSSVHKGNWTYEASHLYLYDKEGNLIEDLNDSEDDLAGREVIVQSSGFKLQLVAPEGSCTDYGFRIEKIAAVEAGMIDAGEHGNNLKWSLSEDGVLKIEGTGEMEYTSSYSYPWKDFSESVKKVVICEGVESVSNSAFSDMYSIEEIEFPSTLKKIGYSAFSFCSGIKYFELPREMKEIEDWAFDYTSYEEMVLPDTVEIIGDYALSAKYGRIFHVNSGTQMAEHMLAKGFKNYLSYEKLETPEITVTSNAPNTVLVEWGSVKGAQQYQVYRVSGGNRTLLDTVEKGTLFFEDTENISKGQTYTYQVRAFKTIRGEKCYSDYSESKVFTYEGTAVQGYNVYAYNYNKIKMYWDAMEEAASYEIYYSTSENGEYKKLTTVNAKDELAYVHEGVSTGHYYYYKIRARMSNGEYSSFSDVKSTRTSPSATTVTVSVKDIESLTISWNKVPNADGYVIYRAPQGVSTLSAIKTIENPDTLQYVDSGLTTGEAYSYIVRAYVTVDGSKVYGSYATAVSGTPTLVAPTAKAASAGYNKIKVSWNKVSGADGYIVYRATSKTGTLSEIKTVTSGSTVSYTNSSLTCGKTYYYMVKAYKKINGKTVVSEDSARCSATPKLSTPSVTVKSAGYNKIKVSWKKITGASGYAIYRATSKTATPKLYKTITSGSTVSYTNSSLTCGKTYYYTVKAYRTVSGKKVYSSSSTKKNTKPVPATPTVTLKKKTSTSITVKWKKITGASGYEIYRSTSKSGTYKKVKTITKGSTVSYTNTGCKKKTRYYYKVRAYRTVSGKKVYGSYSTLKNLKL